MCFVLKQQPPLHLGPNMGAAEKKEVFVTFCLMNIFNSIQKYFHIDICNDICDIFNDVCDICDVCDSIVHISSSKVTFMDIGESDPIDLTKLL